MRRPLLRYALAISVLVLAAILRLWRIASLPPGLYFDEAHHLLSAQQIGRNGKLPIYFEWGEGNDPLLAYLAAFTLFVLGPVPWAGRLVVAWAGLLSVAATIRVGIEMFPRRNSGALAGASLAILFWHINLSRYGIQPMLAGAAAPGAIAAWWYAARTGRLQAYMAAGVSIGLGLVSYVAYRLPIAIGLVMLAIRPHGRRSLFVGGLIAAVVAAIIFTPLGLFFLQSPQWFFGRFQATTDVTLQGTHPAQTLWANTLTVIGGLFMHGSEDWRQNIAGRPGLDMAQALLFGLGCGVSLRRWRTLEVGTLFVWLGLGLLPSILTEYPPNFQRMVMALPPVALFIAQGAESIPHWLPRKQVGWLLVLAMLACSAVINIRDYFGRWAHDPLVFRAYDAGLYWMARQLRAAPPGSTLLETPVLREWSTFEFTLGAEAYNRFKTFNGRECFVGLASTRANTTYAVVVAEDLATLSTLETVFPQGRQTAQEAVGGAPYAVVYQVPAGQLAQLPTQVTRTVSFAGILAMHGYTLTTPKVKAGDTLRLTVAWEVNHMTTAAYKTFVHLHGPPKVDGSIVYAQRDAEPCDNSYPSWQWSPGEIIIEDYKVPVPTDVPPGDYVIRLGWYDALTQARLPATDLTGQSLGDMIEIEHVRVDSP